MGVNEVSQRAMAVAGTAACVVCWAFVTVIGFGSAERLLRVTEPDYFVEKEMSYGLIVRLIHFFWQNGKSGYEHVWPELEFGWRVVVGSIIGFFGAALGNVGGVGGGGVFIPMLTLIIGFDPKHSTAIPKCMIMDAVGSTMYYNLRLRLPTVDMPVIDYDLALLFQPMLLGISIGVAFNVMFADWMVIGLLLILFLGTSTRALLKGKDTWKKETITKKEKKKEMKMKKVDNHIRERTMLTSRIAYGSGEEYKPLPSSPAALADEEVHPLSNVYWKEFALLVFVWIAFLAIQIIKTNTTTCSVKYWILNSLQVPIAVSVTLYEAICLYKGTRMIASKGKEITNWKAHMLFLYCCCGIVAGIVGGLLGLGGGVIFGALFEELGIPPQVASATSTFAMAFSSSMSVVQNLLKRFPVPYATFFVLVATIAAITGQHVVRRVIALFGRASIIIFILALTIFASAISLGGVGIENMIEKLENQVYLGFENLCNRT